MTIRVLFVDDEQSLLNSIKRRLGSQFFLTTATSGREALEIIESSEVFPVVFSDMRMPWMEGTEFIKKARKISPATTYIMLTGNQDQETAREAVNDCDVFRFLRKPIHTSDIADTIIAANEDYKARLKNKKLNACDDLLAAKVFDEIADFSCVADIEYQSLVIAYVSLLSQGIESDGAELKRAVKFTFMTAHLRDIDLRSAATQSEGEQRDRFDMASSEIVKILLHVPGLDLAAGIMFAAQKATGSITKPDSDAKSAMLRFYGECLRVSLCWIGLGETTDQSERKEKLKAVLPDVNESTLQILMECQVDSMA